MSAQLQQLLQPRQSKHFSKYRLSNNLKMSRIMNRQLTSVTCCTYDSNCGDGGDVDSWCILRLAQINIYLGLLM